ncbi:trypsin-like peptidase domain-containing protein [Sinorhizobium meliloti]|uniref:trypsin-like peptidase domain-containing protein n=1 Tax=Rhizobium meliloti TaxID=382 RepID=UPI00398CE47F
MKQLIVWLAAFLAVSANSAAEEPTAGAYHPKCPAAYDRLVQKVPEIDGPTEADVQRLIGRDPQAFLEYGEKCLVPVSDAKSLTINFLKDHLVVLFKLVGDQYSVLCSGFRIARDLIVTAQHCRTPRVQVRVRLFSSPTTDLRVIKRVYPVEFLRLTDASDFMIYQIEDPGDNYRVDLQHFSHDRLRQQAVIVVAASAVDFRYILNSDPDRWTEAVRFSRVNGARLFESEEDNLLSRPAHCLIHGSPTYPGMSGAAVIGIWADKQAKHGARLAIIGVHLRSGRVADRAKIDEVNCGRHSELNMGISLPKAVFEAIQ